MFCVDLVAEFLKALLACSLFIIFQKEIIVRITITTIIIYISWFLFLFTTRKAPATKRALFTGRTSLVLLLNGNWDTPTAGKLSFISLLSPAFFYQWAGLLFLSQRKKSQYLSRFSPNTIFTCHDGFISLYSLGFLLSDHFFSSDPSLHRLWFWQWK